MTRDIELFANCETRVFYNMKNGIYLVFLFLVLGYTAWAQTTPVDALMPAVYYFENHPFDSLHHKESDNLVAFLKESLSLKRGDHQFLIMLKMKVNPSMECLFVRAYLFGKASWIHSNKNLGNNNMAKIAGIKAVNALYRKIRTINPLFKIPLAESLAKYELSGQLDSVVADALSDDPHAQVGEYAVPMVPLIRGVATDPLYGYKPDNPIKLGSNNYSPENIYFSELRGPNGESLKRKLVHAACEGNVWRKITGNAALLDEYEITIPGKDRVIMLYFDAYHKDTVFCPTGFTFVH